MPLFYRKRVWPILMGERLKRATKRWERMEQNYGNPAQVTHTFAILLKRCGESKSLGEGRELYKIIRRRRSTKCIKHLANLSIEMFGKCGSVHEARDAFDVMANRVQYMEPPDEYSFVFMIQAYADNGYIDEARKIFLKMERPHDVAWATMVFAYGDNGLSKKAREMYDWAPQRGAILCTALLKVYAQNGQVCEAQQFFEQIAEKNVLMKNAMIEAYGRAGRLEDAKVVFIGMRKRNVVTYAAMAEAYTLQGHLDKVKLLLSRIEKEMITSWNTTIACYGRAGLVQDAHEVFDVMDEKNVVSWNALVATYGYNGHLHEAVRIFEEMPERNSISWNTLIEIYARNWSPRGAFWLSAVTNLYGFKPNQDGFIALLSACVQLRSIDKGVHVFESMIEDYILLPTKQHYYCMVDLLARSGRLDEARELVDSMPFVPEQTAWMILASAMQGLK